MSYDRREFLKSLTLGGLALFTADWFKLVDETKAASAGKLLPALPGQKVSAKGDQIRAFWASDHFELCLNGTIYDEVPDFEDEDAEEFDDSEFEQDEEESEEEFEERVQEARDEWESEQSSDREGRLANHEFDWYRRSCPGAQAVPYLRDVFDALEANSDGVDPGDYSNIGGIEFHDGAHPGDDTYVAATAQDYETLAALQSALVALGRNCRVVIVEPNPADAAKADDELNS
jgi:hypothetical protein